jgi:hypothetical protein
MRGQDTSGDRDGKVFRIAYTVIKLEVRDSPEPAHGTALT